MLSTETSTLITGSAPSEDDEQALLERIAKREERRQKRMKEALERQKEFDPTITDENATEENQGRKEDAEVSHNEVPSTETNSWKESKEKENLEVETTAKDEPIQTPEKTEDERPNTSYQEQQVFLLKRQNVLLLLYFMIKVH